MSFAVKTIVFVSNYFNHHQKPLSDSFYSVLKSGYSFIETMPMEEERLSLGWKDFEESYIIKSHLDEDSYAKSLMKINEADVVIFGSAPLNFISERVKRNKLVFRYSERIFRSIKDELKFLYRYAKYRNDYPVNGNSYLLCSSAYSSMDYRRLGLFVNKAFKWAYFTEVKKYSIENLLDLKNKNEILWCGRFLKLKHLDDVLRALKKIDSEGYKFTFNIIGSGEEEENLRALTDDLKFNGKINFLGSMKHNEVRTYMEKAGIFIFSSDYNEGWGAVINEALNSACAVISSHAAGATPFLIKNQDNGLIYKSGSITELISCIKLLLNNYDVQESYGKKAYETMTVLWNSEVAVTRFIKMCNEILNNEKITAYKDGPCSIAPILKNAWYKSDLGKKYQCQK